MMVLSMCSNALHCVLYVSASLCIQSMRYWNFSITQNFCEFGGEMTDCIIQLFIHKKIVNSLIGILLIDFVFQKDDESHATSNYVTIYKTAILIENYIHLSHAFSPIMVISRNHQYHA